MLLRSVWSLKLTIFYNFKNRLESKKAFLCLFPILDKIPLLDYTDLLWFIDNKRGLSKAKHINHVKA